MSRPGPAAPRQLSATEELEKLEQSITLTLQEIDHNFSKAHRIVTTSILPLVEQYGEHSRAVWDASKFWKQFFEASANVSLSGYEELANEGGDDTTVAEGTTVQDTTVAYDTPRPRTRSNSRGDDHTTTTTTSDRPSGDESLLTDDGAGDLTGSTPRPPATKTLEPQFADLDSPYENLRKQHIGSASRDSKKNQSTTPTGTGPFDPDDENTYQLGDDDPTQSTESMILAQHTARLPDMSMTPLSHRAHSRPPARGAPIEISAAGGRSNKDPLLHRILDKNYRIQATPIRGALGGGMMPPHGVSPIKWRVTEKEKPKAREEKREVWQDSPMSSPEMAMPKLRSEAFISPLKAAYRGGPGAARYGGAAAPRTPGVSVQTPATGRKTRDVFASAGTVEGAEQDTTREKKEKKDEITWESDSDEEYGDLYGGMSPPKTIQFALPQSRLLQTPAREASRRIVEDILLTAGAGPEDSEYSPTVVKMNPDILDDTF